MSPRPILDMKGVGNMEVSIDCAGGVPATIVPQLFHLPEAVGINDD